MSTFDIDGVRRTVAAAAKAMAGLEQELNAADAKLGDGDTGGMLARVIGALDGARLPEGGDVGTAFSAYAKAAAMATGSSLGTLLATALMTLARETRGRDAVPVSELGDLLAKARDAMMARGGAGLGDKTVLDALDAVASAIAGVDDAGDAGQRAVLAAGDALDRFRQKPNKVGRARMFAEATIGLDDPGMLAFARLCAAVAPASA